MAAIGGVAGAFAAVMMFTPSTTGDGTAATTSQLVGIAAAGYSGADFIEGFITRISGAQSQQPQTSAAWAGSSDDAVG
jgi:hypothetical protein